MIPIPMVKCPCWDGVNIAWELREASRRKDAPEGRQADRPIPLQELLRMIGKELDELDARHLVIAETPTGFMASIEVAGEPVRRHYTSAEIAARAEQSRRRRGKETS